MMLFRRWVIGLRWRGDTNNVIYRYDNKDIVKAWCVGLRATASGIIDEKGGRWPFSRHLPPYRLSALPPYYSSFTSAIRFFSESFASPNSIDVAVAKKSSLSTPAKPGRMLRFITIQACDLSTSRIGIP